MSNDDDEATAIAYARESAQADLINATRAYEDAQRRGDATEAGSALRYMALHQQQVQQFDNLARKNSPESQFSARESQWMAQRPSLMQNPAKVQQVSQVAQQLMAQGYQRDSDAFFNALNLRIDAPSELPSPDEAVQITMGNSKYANIKDPKDHQDAVNRYNRGVQDLYQRKQSGDYR
jgi:hypothetical protein